MTQPMTSAWITLVEGEQGQGKTTIPVARGVDKTFTNVTGLKLEDGRIFKATPTNPPKIGQVTIWLPDKEPFAIRVPKKSCVIADGVRLYANFHFYGIRAVFLSVSQIIEYLNAGYIMDGDLIMDEHYIGGSARESMSQVVKTINKLSNQMRKRGVHLTLCAPISRDIDWRQRWNVTEHIMCHDYDEKTQMIHFTLKRKGDRRPQEKSFWGKQYWSYFNTRELISLSENEVNKAVASAT